jgi:hypothetical protein
VLALENEVPEKDAGKKDDRKKVIEEQAKPQLNLRIALTSSQDRLYALISAVPQEDTSKQQEDELKEHSPFKEKSIKNKYSDRAKARTAYYQQLESNFLKSFQALPVSKDSTLAVQDQTLGLTVPLPPEWFYTRYQTANNQQTASTTLLMPLSTITLISGNLDQLTAKNYKGLIQEGLATNFAELFTSRSHKFLDGMTEVLTLTSYQNKKEAPYAGYLKNKEETTKFLNTFFKALETTAKTDADAKDNFSPQDATLKTLQQSHQLTMDSRHGVLTLASQYELNDSNKTRLNYDAKIGFTTDKFGSVSYLRKVNQEKDPGQDKKTTAGNGREKLYQSLQLFSK